MQPFHGYVIVGYYTSWSIYSRNYPVWMIDPHSITHLNYAFANLNAEGEVILGDPWADVDKVNTGQGDSWSDPAGSLHGNFHQLWLLKQRNRSLKVGLSVGGWTWSGHFSQVASNDAGRKRFASTAVRLMMDLGLDYLDLDWEYPGGGGLAGNGASPDDAVNLVKLLGAIRAEYAKHNLTKAQLTAAISCNLTHYDLSGMAKHLDYFLLMGYDFSGSWSDTADHQANLYARDTGNLSVDGAIRQLLQQPGVNARQIVMGVPFYGRSFAQTAGLGQPFKGLGPGSWEPGILDYKAIPPAGCQARWEPITNSTFCYNPLYHLLVSYDDPTSMAFKLQYLRKLGLGGVMFWDLSADRPLDDPRSLLRIINAWIGGPWKDTTLNNLCYPHSKYPNLVCQSPKLETTIPSETELHLIEATSTSQASTTMPSTLSSQVITATAYTSTSTQLTHTAQQTTTHTEQQTPTQTAYQTTTQSSTRTESFTTPTHNEHQATTASATPHFY